MATPPLNIDESMFEISGLDLFNRVRERMGWTDRYLKSINDAQHPLLKDIDQMVMALEILRSTDKEITIVPDFDTDGICAGMILYAGLNEIGLTTNLHVPDYHLGHEIQPTVISTVKQQFPNTEAVITCDAGTNSRDALAYANHIGLITLVTDHHVEEIKSLAHILVNPNRIDETYPNREICGAHVAYQVVERYASLYHPDKLSAITWLKVFAGIGTVADVMSLVYENRDLVREALMFTRLLIATPEPEPTYTWVKSKYEEPDEFDGSDIPIDRTPTLLAMLRSQNHHPVYMRAFEGLSMLLEELGTTHERVDEQLYGFSIAPAFNATRRVDGDYRTGFAVFTANTPDEQRAAAQRLVEYNLQRKTQVQKILGEILESDQPWAPYVFPTDALPGMLGLIAQNLMLMHGHPVAVVCIHADGSCSGSMRSPTWFPVIEQLSSLQDPTIGAQGHEFACGVHAPSPQALCNALATLVPKRRDEIIAETGVLIHSDPAALVLGTSSDADAPLYEIKAITQYMGAVRELAPFGHGFPAPPVDMVINLATCSIHTMGDQKQHLKIITPEGVALLWWNRSDLAPLLRERKNSVDPADTMYRLRVTLNLNTFAGRTTLQGIVDHEVEIEPGS
jgi:single-stranded-DNA-specific exonuclease